MHTRVIPVLGQDGKLVTAALWKIDPQAPMVAAVSKGFKFAVDEVQIADESPSEREHAMGMCPSDSPRRSCRRRDHVAAAAAPLVSRGQARGGRQPRVPLEHSDTTCEERGRTRGQAPGSQKPGQHASCRRDDHMRNRAAGSRRSTFDQRTEGARMVIESCGAHEARAGHGDHPSIAGEAGCLEEEA